MGYIWATLLGGSFKRKEKVMNESQKKAMEIVDNIRKTMENGNTHHLEERSLNVLQATLLCILLVLFITAFVYISL